jgi:hypothetical protein
MCARAEPGTVTFRPLTPATWRDFEALFGKSGACGGCWCMWWRQTRREFEQRHGAANRRSMKRIVDSGRVPGIIAYVSQEPVGWCSVAPREEFPSLNRSRVLRRIDDRPVWSIVCFYVEKGRRSTGMMDELIRGAVDHVRRSGGQAIEAYPTRPRGKRLAQVSSFMGTPGPFERAGFVVCARPSDARLIVRLEIGRSRKSG